MGLCIRVCTLQFVMVHEGYEVVFGGEQGAEIRAVKKVFGAAFRLGRGRGDGSWWS